MFSDSRLTLHIIVSLREGRPLNFMYTTQESLADFDNLSEALTLIMIVIAKFSIIDLASNNI